jgi:hypothetical protein
MASRVNRSTVDLSEYPDLVVIYLGMRVESFRGIATVMRIGPQIQKAVDSKPDGLLAHEQFLFSLFPPHVGMRQYWRDFASLESWVRTMPHKAWWVNFLKDPGGTAFWHETYLRRGGMEAIYDNLSKPTGLGVFAPLKVARGPMFSARQRAGAGEGAPPPPATESEIYGG